jgi:hypothetical protein
VARQDGREGDHREPSTRSYRIPSNMRLGAAPRQWFVAVVCRYSLPFEVDDQTQLSCELDRQVARTFAFEDPDNIARRLPKEFGMSAP